MNKTSNTKKINNAIPTKSPISILCPLRPATINLPPLNFSLYSFYFVKLGAYFAASRIASIILTALTMPLPAMSNAVP